MSENGNSEKHPKYTVNAGVGHMNARVDAEDSKTAFVLWEKAIDKLVEEVEEMDTEERNEIGLQ